MALFLWINIKIHFRVGKYEFTIGSRSWNYSPEIQKQMQKTTYCHNLLLIS